MELSFIENLFFLYEEEEEEIDAIINDMIIKNKGNIVRINKLVFDCITTLTTSYNSISELDEQRVLNEFWEELLEIYLDKNPIDFNSQLSILQYFSKKIIEKLSEQNLINFELLSVVNNKLNSSIQETDNDINNIYSTLINFFKQTKNEILELEKENTSLENNANLLNWINTIEYQIVNEIESKELSKIDKIIYITRNFYEITKGNWTTNDLLLLKYALYEMKLSHRDLIKYNDFIKFICDNEDLFNKLFEDISDEILSIECSELIIFEAIKKIKNLDKNEKYIINTVKSNLYNNGIVIDDLDLKYSLLYCYILEKSSLDINLGVNLFDFIVELLFNLKILNSIINEKYINYEIDFENMLGEDIEEYYDIEELKFYANRGNSNAQNVISLFYYYKKNYEDAIKYAKMSIENGDSIGNFMLAISYFLKDNVADYTNDIIDNLEKSSEQNFIKAQILLGKIYLGYFSLNLEPDYKNAIKWLTKAADNSENAQFELGELYFDGIGVEKDYAEAFSWYLKSASQGNADAQVSLGYMYSEGEGVIKNYKEAVKWYKKAADQGHTMAQNNLADCYENGHGVEKNYDIALELYMKAAENDNEYAQYNLGLMYLNGIGVICDKEEAKKWFQKSSDLGYEDSKIALIENFLD